MNSAKTSIFVGRGFSVDNRNTEVGGQNPDLEGKEGRCPGERGCPHSPHAWDPSWHPGACGEEL